MSAAYERVLGTLGTSLMAAAGALLKTSLDRIRGPSHFNHQDAAMSINLDTNDIVRMFQVRATAELKRELDEVKWWEDRVRRGLVRREHVEAYIQASKRIIRTKRHVLAVCGKTQEYVIPQPVRFLNGRGICFFLGFLANSRSLTRKRRGFGMTNPTFSAAC
jgi:hypothetical protein